MIVKCVYNIVIDVTAIYVIYERDTAWLHRIYLLFYQSLLIIMNVYPSFRAVV